MAVDPMFKRAILYDDNSLPIDNTNPLPIFNAGIGNWDTCNITYPNSTTVVYTFLNGATTVQTLTIVYSDATRANTTSITRV